MNVATNPNDPNHFALRELIMQLRREAFDLQNLATMKHALCDTLEALIKQNQDQVHLIADQAIDLGLFKSQLALRLNEATPIQEPPKMHHCFNCGGLAVLSPNTMFCDPCLTQNKKKFGRWKMVNGEMVEY